MQSEDNFQHLSSPLTLQSLNIYSSVDFQTQHRGATVEVEEVRANFEQVSVTDGQDGDTSTRGC